MVDQQETAEKPLIQRWAIWIDGHPAQKFGLALLAGVIWSLVTLAF